jgi:RNA-directed DNA polymerase
MERKVPCKRHYNVVGGVAFLNSVQRVGHVVFQSILDHCLTYLKGWYGYFGLVEVPWRFTALSKWISRHIRKFLWQRWHKSDGRRNALHRLGLPPHQLRLGGCGRGAWRMAAHVVMHTALNHERLRRFEFRTPSGLAQASSQK